MPNLSISSDVSRGVIRVQSSQPLADPAILDAAGKVVPAAMIRRRSGGAGGAVVELDARALLPWTPDVPTLYTLQADGGTTCFGYVDLVARGSSVLVNGNPFYFRGYIRGITAHEHPNMTGLPKREFFRKNILQAKKYGFNLVRFHSTIPDGEFVELADELGLFIHLEIGYAYQFDEKGHKTGIRMDRDKWRETIRRFRNNPSVAIFCIGNEMHNAGRMPEAHEMAEIGRGLAPHKLIMDNAGWGEFDRTSSDIFSQHIAYYFPFKSHSAMFDGDFCWEMNGSMHRVPLSTTNRLAHGGITVRRQLNPVRPVLAHECLHYIDIPDYTGLNRRFDAFAARVGPHYLEENGIEKPRYLTALPELIAAKHLEEKMPDYILASRHFKMLGMKTYLERLRLSKNLCGYEMLQFADTLKYENNNGIVDFFDDDKFIDAAWMRQFNADTVLLADFPKENFFAGEDVRAAIHLSDFSGRESSGCGLKIHLVGADGARELVYEGEHFTPVAGLSKLVDITLDLDASKSSATEGSSPNGAVSYSPGQDCAADATLGVGVEKAHCPQRAASPTPPFPPATEYTLEAGFTGPGLSCRNQWKFWVYPQPRLETLPELNVSQPELRSAIGMLGRNLPTNPAILVTDLLDDAALSALEAGRTVIVNYHRDRKGTQYYLPGALDRFKPCIWDRGSHLGGIVTAEWLQEAMGSGRYFDKNFYSLVEAAYKVNLDRFPCPVNEVVQGVDKPVRDRMKALIHGIKDFLPDDTLRNFSYLFSVKVGDGLLIVCTFHLAAAACDPAAAAALCAVINSARAMDTPLAITPAAFKDYLRKTTGAGPLKEDTMNRFWEIDNRPVEDTLFWEEARLDLRKLGSAN